MRSPSTLLAGRTITGSASARLTIDGRRFINFWGSGYLALGDIPEVRAAVSRALGEGVPFSQQVPAVLGGVEPAFNSVEGVGAEVAGTEASVYFPSGYLIGLVGLAALRGTFDAIFLDEQCHFNLRDAARASGLPVHFFPHCDVQATDELLKRNVGAKERPLLATDGVFATTGRISPLSEYGAILAPYNGHMLVDESHGFGVVGANGRGAAEFCAVEDRTMTGATLGKAFCAQGALVGCSAEAAENLRAAPPLRGASAGSPLSAIAATESLRYAQGHPELRYDLRVKAEFLRRRIRELGLEVIDSPAPIVAFRFGTLSDMLELQRRAFQQGIYLYHSMYIGSGEGGLIRCAVFRDHTYEDIDALIAALR
jgi:7-keto-8-aminopelargonate synthetase-like enzyme